MLVDTVLRADVVCQPIKNSSGSSFFWGLKQCLGATTLFDRACTPAPNASENVGHGAPPALLEVR